MNNNQVEILRAHQIWLAGIADALMDTHPKLAEKVGAHAREFARDMTKADPPLFAGESIS